MSLRRFEDARLLRGEGRFVDDHAPPGCLHLVFVRARAAGVISAIDTAAARAVLGVVAVFTGADLAGCGSAKVNPLLPMTGDGGFEPLARGAARAAGQAVGAVIARSARAAQDGAEAVKVVLDGGTRSTDPAEIAGTWGAPVAGKRVARWFQMSVQHARIAPMTLEPRAALAEVDGKFLTLTTATQTPHRVRTDLALILNRDPQSIRVIAPDVGGAFGGKASITPEDAVVAFAAERLGRPVKWRATRSEEFLCATQGRGARMSGRLGVDAKGGLLALEAEAAFPLGHWLPYSAAAPLRNAGRILPGPYAVPQVSVTGRATAAAMPAVNIYRGAGRPEAAMLMERLMDEAAHGLGIDPVRYRLKNLIRPQDLPRQATTGEQLDTGDYPALLRAVCDAGDYTGLRRAQKRRVKRGEITGVGVASYIEPCGQGWESGRVGLSPEGRVVAATGSSAQGQGRETAFAQIVAEVLGVPPASIEVRHGDTARAPAGIGALASRSTAIGGSAIQLAAQAFAQKARQAADGLGLSGGPLDFAGLARALAGAPLRHGLLLTCDEVYDCPGEAWSSGAVLAAVAIDRDTGVLAIERLVWADDAGNIVNPMLVEGQLIGGMAQGFGEALMEQMVYAPDDELMSGSLMDYAVPRARDVPAVEILKLGIPSVMNPLGAKGVGEAGCIGIPAAILNAAVDALRPFGVRHLDMPLTSEKLWQALQGARPGSGADLI